jgi:hypothetical protein
MKLRISNGLICVIVVLAIVIILTAILSSKRVVPYNADGKLSDNLIEGMTNKDKGQDRVRYASYPSGTMMNVENDHLISDTTDDTTNRVKGLPGGLYGPESKSDKITTFADAKGSLSSECQNTSSGYTNSTGYLCLDKKQLNMLATRGGNQTCSTCYTGSDGCNCNK